MALSRSSRHGGVSAPLTARPAPECNGVRYSFVMAVDTLPRSAARLPSTAIACSRSARFSLVAPR